MTKLQCVETCRKQYQDYSVYNGDLSTCHCMDVLETDLVIIKHPARCGGKHYQVFRNSDFPAVTSCDDLYFKKQALFWDDYRIGNIAGSCHYSKPANLLYGSWNQKSEKLARTSLLFSDKISVDTPDQGDLSSILIGPAPTSLLSLVESFQLLKYFDMVGWLPST